MFSVAHVHLFMLSSQPSRYRRTFIGMLSGRVPEKHLNIFSVPYPLLRMRPQTLNYWKEPIPGRTQFEKNSVGNPAIFALKQLSRAASGHFEHSVTWRRDRESRNADPFHEFMDNIRTLYHVY